MITPRLTITCESGEFMMTQSNGNISALLALCADNSPVTCEFPSQRPVTRSFDVFFDVRLNKQLSKQSWGWRFETPMRSFWRHCNVMNFFHLASRTLRPHKMVAVLQTSHSNVFSGRKTFSYIDFTFAEHALIREIHNISVLVHVIVHCEIFE